jgi:hypothetical protein
VGCNNNSSRSHEYSNIYLIPDSAEWVVRKAIEAHGGFWNGRKTSFTFREHNYSFIIDSGKYTYSVSYFENENSILFTLTNQGVSFKLNGRDSVLDAHTASVKAASLNSVIYFFMLPQRLFDPAVIIEYKGVQEVEGQPHYCIGVTFKAEQGGEDHDDQFVFWFEKSGFNMNYLAYQYRRNGGGIRFRKAIETKVVNGFKIQNYINYKTDSLNTSLTDLPNKFQDGLLEELSVIQIDSVAIY